MKTNCECANRRAAESAAEVERLNGRLAEVTQKWNELLTSNGQLIISNGELREEFEQCRKDNLGLMSALEKSMAREEAMHASFSDFSKRLNDGLANASTAADTMTGQIRDRDRQISELRQRLIDNALDSRAKRIGWAA